MYFLRPDCGNVQRRLSLRQPRPKGPLLQFAEEAVLSLRPGVVLVPIRTRDDDGDTGLRRSPRIEMDSVLNGRHCRLSWKREGPVLKNRKWLISDRIVSRIGGWASLEA